MKKFEVTIEETSVKTFEIKALSEDEAIEKAIEQYKNGEIDLTDAEVQFKQISTDCSDWIEF